MKTLRTPDDRFAGLPGFDFDPHYAEVADGEGGTLRVHYLREGDPAAPVVLLMHGEPSWSYLYRKMIPVLTGAGLQIVAPDLVGFGRSDKPAERSDYTFARHVEWMRELLFDRLDLRDITLVCQDWGGLIGLRLVGSTPTASPGSWRPTRSCRPATPIRARRSSPGSASPRRWRSSRPASSSAAAAPSASLRGGGGLRRALSPTSPTSPGPAPFPMLVPSRPDDPAHDANVAAWVGLAAFDRPFLCAFSDSDPITKGADRNLKERIAGAQGQPHTTIVGGGHFLQEDCGEELAQVVVAFVASDLVTSEHRVVIVGAGFSGIGMAARLRSMGVEDFVVLDRGNDLGGTWRDNSYPGAACDVPSNLYSFSFALNPDWSRSFSSQSEIWDYMRALRRPLRGGRAPAFRPGRRGGALGRGHGALGRADDRGEEYVAPVLVWATGSLSEPSIPDFPGLADFRGKVFHSARWEHGFDLTGKRVCVVGTGASAIQFVPQIAPVVEHLYLHQRTPPFIVPRRDRAVSRPAQARLPQGAARSSACPGLRIYAIFESLLSVFVGHGERRKARGPQGRPRPPRQAGTRRGAAREAHPALRAGLQAPAALRRLLPLAHPAQRRGRGRHRWPRSPRTRWWARTASPARSTS